MAQYWAVFYVPCRKVRHGRGAKNYTQTRHLHSVDPARGDAWRGKNSAENGQKNEPHSCWLGMGGGEQKLRWWQQCTNLPHMLRITPPWFFGGRSSEDNKKGGHIMGPYTRLETPKPGKKGDKYGALGTQLTEEGLTLHSFLRGHESMKFWYSPFFFSFLVFQRQVRFLYFFGPEISALCCLYATLSNVLLGHPPQKTTWLQRKLLYFHSQAKVKVWGSLGPHLLHLVNHLVSCRPCLLSHC